MRALFLMQKRLLERLCNFKFHFGYKVVVDDRIQILVTFLNVVRSSYEAAYDKKRGCRMSYLYDMSHTPYI